MAHAYVVVGSESVFLVCEFAVFWVKSQAFFYSVWLIVSYTYSVECKRSPHRIIQHPRTEKEPLEELNSILELSFLFTQNSQIIRHMTFLLNISYLYSSFRSHFHISKRSSVQILSSWGNRGRPAATRRERCGNRSVVTFGRLDMDLLGEERLGYWFFLFIFLLL